MVLIMRGRMGHAETPDGFSISGEDDAPQAILPGPSATAQHPRLAASSARKDDEIRESGEANGRASKEKKLVILDYHCYQPNRKLKFYRKGIALLEFDSAFYSLKVMSRLSSAHIVC
jgi:hypothetical protein